MPKRLRFGPFRRRIEGILNFERDVWGWVWSMEMGVESWVYYRLFGVG